MRLNRWAWMTATCFPCCFLSDHARAFLARGLIWARYFKAEPGTFGNECGKPTAFIGTKLATGAQACFCADCKERGHEARGFGEWQVVDWAGQGAP